MLFQKMSMYSNRGDLCYLMELCPGLLRMQQNFAEDLVKVPWDSKGYLASSFLMIQPVPSMSIMMRRIESQA